MPCHVADLNSPLLSPTSVPALSPRVTSPISSNRSPTRRRIADIDNRDISFLLQPQNFSAVPASLSQAPKQDQTHGGLLQHIKNGEFNSAATLSAKLIIEITDTSDTQTIFNLWYIRLACLTLIHETKLAATESKVLGDLTSPFYRATKTHLVPWHLRVLAVRLQALGFGEWRRGIMAYYILAEEARQEATVASMEESRSDLRLWKARLHDLGILVGSALVEMGDLEAAARHVSNLERDRDLSETQSQKLVMMECLIWLKVGDLKTAAECLARFSGAEENTSSETDSAYVRGILNAVITTCRGDPAATLKEWEDLEEQYPDDPLIQHNLAVSSLYTCDLKNSKAAFETLVESESIPSYQSLLFNTATLYELSTENSIVLKEQLAEKVLKNNAHETTKEHGPTDFKLEVR